MPFVFLIPGPLRPLAGDRGEVRVDGEAASVGDALSLLFRQYPGIRDRVLTELNEIRPHVNVFVDGENARHTGLTRPIRDGAEIVILPAVSGGETPGEPRS